MTVSKECLRRTTRALLVNSQKWEDETKKLNIIALVKAGPINMDKWIRDDFDDVVSWVFNESLVMPSVLRVYLELVDGVRR